MLNQHHKKWFLILNKTVRGPFSYEELKSLVEEGLIKRTDLALLVQEIEGESKKGNWKFLWQYPEFDSRSSKSPPPSLPSDDKRQVKTTDQVQQEIEENVPLDLREISIDDLIVRAKTRSRKETFTFGTDSESSFADSELKSGDTSRPSWTKAIPLVLFAFAVIGMILAQSSKPNKKITEVVPSPAPREVASPEKNVLPGPRHPMANRGPGPRRNPDRRGGPPRRPPGVLPPKERDRGQIREDEMLRLREAERLKELEERARREREKEQELKRRDESEKDIESDEPSDEKDLEEEDAFDRPQKARTKKRENDRPSNIQDEEDPEEKEPYDSDSPPSEWLED